MNIDPLAATPDTNSPAYMVAIILGKIPYSDLLESAVWEQFTKAMQPLASKTSYPGSVMARQLLTDGSKVKFPKSVPWNSKQQYALHERLRPAPDDMRKLLGFQYFAMFPDQTKWTNSIYPELFFMMDKHVLPKDYGRFTIGCVLMIQTQTLAGDVHLFDQALASLSALFQATLVLKKVRHFQDKLLIGGYTNALTDLSPCTIFENRENFTLGPEVADWEVILRQDLSS